MTRYLQLNDLNCYKRSFILSNYVWDIVVRWEHLAKSTVGSQKESLDWNEKSKARGLLREKEYSHIIAELQELPREINQLIKFTRERLRE